MTSNATGSGNNDDIEYPTDFGEGGEEENDAEQQGGAEEQEDAQEGQQQQEDAPEEHPAQDDAGQAEYGYDDAWAYARQQRSSDDDWYRVGSSGTNSGDSQYGWGSYAQSRNYAQSGVSISRDQRGQEPDGKGLKPGDAPPIWDGKEPQRNVKTYLKMLNLWLRTTRTSKDSRGYVLYNASKGDLRELYDSLDEDDLAADDCPQKMILLIKEMFAQFLLRPIPEIVENALFDQAKTNRKGGENMALYIQRRTRYWKDLEKEKITIPDEMKAYLLYRGAGLNTTAVDTIQTWTQGAWDLEQMKTSLIKLEHHTRGWG